jgi:peptidoglycan hydrolase CwlO-like protein
MAAVPSNHEFDDIYSLNKDIEKLSDELKDLLHENDKRGAVLNKASNRRIETLQEKINNLKLKRRSLLNTSHNGKIKK